MEACCDCTFAFMLLFLLLTAGGVGAIIGTNKDDNLFNKFYTNNGDDLDAQMAPYIKWKNLKLDSGTPKPCSSRKLVGSHGSICMEDNLNANVLTTQLSQWNNARDSLWCLAIIYTFVAVVYALFINCQREAIGSTGPEVLEGLPPLSAEKQAELLQMSPSQQQYFMREYQRFAAENSTAQPHPQGYPRQDGGTGRQSNSKVQVYDTPFYEFMRIAWLFIGFTVLAWTVNLLISFWSFYPFYSRETTGPLHDFWVNYQRRFTSTLVLITLYLAWPFFNFFVDLLVFIVFLIPWLVIRAVCFSQIGNYRPSLMLSKLPGWIRIDMFFMDMQDIRRLGFSRQAWIILTGSEQPFCSYEDPEVDRDPNMTSLRQWRNQWYTNMYGAPPPWVCPVMVQTGMSASQSSEPYCGAYKNTPPPGSTQEAHTANNGVPNEYFAHPVSGPNPPGDIAKVDHPFSGDAQPSKAPEQSLKHDRSDSTSISASFSPAAGTSPAEGISRHHHRHRRHHRSRSHNGQGAEPRERDAGASPHRRRHRRNHSHVSNGESTVVNKQKPDVQPPPPGAGPGGRVQNFPDTPSFTPASKFDTDTSLKLQSGGVIGPNRDTRGGSLNPTQETPSSQWQGLNQNRGLTHQDQGGRNEGKNLQEMELDELMKL